MDGPSRIHYLFDAYKYLLNIYYVSGTMSNDDLEEGMANHSGHTQLKQLSTHVKWWHNTVFRLQPSKQTDSLCDLHTEMEAFQVWRVWKGQILPWGGCIRADQTQTWPEIPGEPLRQTRGTNASAMGTLKRQDIFKAISVISLGEAWDGVYTILAS